MPAIFFTLLFIFLAVPPAIAERDSVTTGINIVEDFYGETAELLGRVRTGGPVQAFLTDSAEEKKKAVTNLKAMRWLRSPGRDRYDAVISVVDGFISGRISALKKTAKRVEKPQGQRLDAVIKALEALRKKQLAQLAESLAAETYREKRAPPVPVIDRPPFLNEPGEGRGIWFR